MADSIPINDIAHVIQLSVAPVFLLAGLGAFLNVCAGRLARIIDRSRQLEPRVLASRGEEHDRLLGEVRVLDRRIAVVNNAIFTTVLAAVLISLVVILLFVAFLTGYRVGTAIALLFIAAMICTGAGFAIFLHEWLVKPGTSTPDPFEMTDFNLFTFNSRVFPGTEPLLARLGDRVRIRIANISMDSHPIHVHGHHFRWTGSDAGPLPDTAEMFEIAHAIFVQDDSLDWKPDLPECAYRNE